jgi:hypothetical protein
MQRAHTCGVVERPTPRPKPPETRTTPSGCRQQAHPSPETLIDFTLLINKNRYKFCSGSSHSIRGQPTPLRAIGRDGVRRRRRLPWASR